jgi:hypothetical protein
MKNTQEANKRKEKKGPKSKQKITLKNAKLIMGSSKRRNQVTLVLHIPTRLKCHTNIYERGIHDVNYKMNISHKVENRPQTSNKLK